jgi:hypothetical protein
MAPQKGVTGFKRNAKGRMYRRGAALDPCNVAAIVDTHRTSSTRTYSATAKACQVSVTTVKSTLRVVFIRLLESPSASSNKRSFSFAGLVRSR